MIPFERELLRAYDACDMNRVEAAKQLGMRGDWNTLVTLYFNRIYKETGLSPRNRDDLTKLLSLIDKEESDES